jgi:hypothetical protein
MECPNCGDPISTGREMITQYLCTCTRSERFAAAHRKESAKDAAIRADEREKIAAEAERLRVGWKTGPQMDQDWHSFAEHIRNTSKGEDV